MHATLRKTPLALLSAALLAACSSPGPVLPADQPDDTSAPRAVLPDSLAAAPRPDTASAPVWGGFIGSSGD